jgi:hypothetical protein
VLFDDSGRLVHRCGVAAAPGVYFLGLTWQHTRGSALLGRVREDAEYIARHSSAFRTSAVSSCDDPIGLVSWSSPGPEAGREPEGRVTPAVDRKTMARYGVSDISGRQMARPSDDHLHRSPTESRHDHER